jgi:2-oxoglutarate ferredoxin oxidoreductase subunit beta
MVLLRGSTRPLRRSEKVTKSSPMGAIDYPLNPLSLALACEATFVARSIDVHIKHLGETLRRAAEHHGTAFVEVYQNCNVFNDGAYDYVTDKEVKADHLVELEHGKPLVFGNGRHRGIVLENGAPRAVELGQGYSESDLLVHDERAEQPTLAYLLSRMRYPDLPEPIGVLRDVERPRYERELVRQVTEAKGKRGEGSLEQLFASAETWTVT